MLFRGLTRFGFGLSRLFDGCLANVILDSGHFEMILLLGCYVCLGVLSAGGINGAVWFEMWEGGLRGLNLVVVVCVN